MLFLCSRLQMLWTDQIQEGVTMGECVCVSLANSKTAHIQWQEKVCEPIRIDWFSALLTSSDLH